MDSARWCQHCGGHGDHHTDRHLVGTRWKINDTGGIFTVVAADSRYLTVENERGTRRRILAHRVRESKAQTGYQRL